MHEEIIKASPLFKDLSEKEYEYALKYFEARVVKFKKGDTLNTITKKLAWFGLVLDGIVQVYMDDVDGREIIMASNAPGSSFGESLCYLGKEPPVYIKAVSDVCVLKMKTSKMQQLSKSDLDLELKNRFISILAERTLQMNNRIQILSKVTVRDKLLTFFAQIENANAKKEFTIPFDRNDMAVYLGVNRSALSRELSIMKSEGLIVYHKNKFRLL